MSQKNYITYTTEDFLNDPDFIAAVKGRDIQKTEFWYRLIAEKQVDAVVFHDAELQLQVILSAVQIHPPAGFINLLEKDILHTIREEGKVRVLKLRRTLIAVAVAASVLAGITVAWFFNSDVTVSTGYAQNQMVLLPDGTQITLNAASEITYPRAMAYGRARQVKLKGEAFFNVVHLNRDTLHIKPSEIFTVLTPRLKIEVLGTQFNVKERRGRPEVYLVKGKVRINGDRIRQVLKPDELLSYRSASSYQKTATVPDSHLSWITHKMLVHNTSLKDVLDNFEDVFGKRIILQNAGLYRQAIDGTIAMDNEDNTLFILSAITSSRIVRHGDTIYFVPVNNP